MSIRTAAGLGTMTTVVRGDVLAEDNVSRAGGLRWVLDDGFFFQNLMFNTVVLRG